LGRFGLQRLKDYRTNAAFSGQRVPDEGPEVGSIAIEDSRLVAAVLANDRKATAEFMARYTGSVYDYIHARLTPRHDGVEDLVSRRLPFRLGEP
jgi:hypothetical protein